MSSSSFEQVVAQAAGEVWWRCAWRVRMVRRAAMPSSPLDALVPTEHRLVVEHRSTVRFGSGARCVWAVQRGHHHAAGRWISADDLGWGGV